MRSNDGTAARVAKYAAHNQMRGALKKQEREELSEPTSTNNSSLGY
jgi:hypothetical protein